MIIKFILQLDKQLRNGLLVELQKSFNEQYYTALLEKKGKETAV